MDGEVNPYLKPSTSRSYLDDSYPDLRWAMEVRKRDRAGLLGVLVLPAESDPDTGALTYMGLSLFTEAEMWE